MKRWRIAHIVILVAVAGCDPSSGGKATITDEEPQSTRLELIDLQGRLDANAVKGWGLDEKTKAHLQGIIDEQRVSWFKVVLESLRRRHDDYGNLLIEIPDLRAEGKVFRTRLFEAIHKGVGDTVSDHFDVLNKEQKLSGMFSSLSDDWFHFGEPVIYIVRGGKDDDRRDEIPPGEIWIQFVEEWDTIEGGYETSIYMRPYEELPSQLREILSERDAEPFVGPERPITEQGAGHRP